MSFPRAHLLRYGLAAAGPVASAATQLLLSLLLLRALPAAEFGRFAFLLVLAQFSWGLWSALFCAPLATLLAGDRGEHKDTVQRALFSANLIAASVALLLFFGIALAVGMTPLAATIFGAFNSIALLRWFARAHAYATGRPLRTTSSDLVYSAVLLGAVAVIALEGSASLVAAFLALLLSAAAGLAVFGSAYLRRQFGLLSIGASKAYAPVWRAHSRWSVVGVATTEAAANAHVYLVTALLGPAAYAPIAATALLIRPIGVATNALIEFERAQMARQLHAGDPGGARRSVRISRLVLVAIWIGTAGAAAALLAFAPRAIFPAQYGMEVLLLGTILWMMVSLVRLVRSSESALLQAAGAFRPLAYASVFACGVSILLVLVFLAILPPLWTLIGILAGEAIMSLLTFRTSRVLLSETDKSSGSVA